ncbi:hypothetical protein JD844_033737 [Phrynosoma platyrhinos]|uniref:C2 domain-containing protein n=1 Tax=Phrynosoma platyrhinos TaxID=52577 RepID=A0ABQ7T742_PHRPL|nr:hypothetical protein JD844_033737 [Phrynosoma platyrhinos]
MKEKAKNALAKCKKKELDRDMGALILEVITKSDHLPVGRVQISGLAQLSPSHPISGFFTIVSPTSQKMGELQVSLVLEPLSETYDSSSSIPNTDMSLSVGLPAPEAQEAPESSQFLPLPPHQRPPNVKAIGRDSENSENLGPQHHLISGQNDPLKPNNPKQYGQFPNSFNHEAQLKLAGRSHNPIRVLSSSNTATKDLISALLDQGSRLREAMVVSAMKSSPDSGIELHEAHPSLKNFKNLNLGLVSAVEDPLQQPPEYSEFDLHAENRAIQLLLGSSDLSPVRLLDGTHSPLESLSLGSEAYDSELNDPHYDQSLLENLFYTAQTSMESTEETQTVKLSLDRLAVLSRIHLARMVVESLKIPLEESTRSTPGKKISAGKPPRPTLAKKRTFFVEYHFPVGTSKTGTGQSAITTEIVRVASSKVSGEAALPLRDVIQSEQLMVSCELHVKEGGGPAQLGPLKVSLELAADNKDFSITSTKTVNVVSQTPVYTIRSPGAKVQDVDKIPSPAENSQLLKQSSYQFPKRTQEPLLATSEKPIVDVNHQSGPRPVSRNLLAQISASEEEGLLLHVLLMVPEGQIFAPRDAGLLGSCNVYLNCKLFNTEEATRSAVTPISLTSKHLERLKNNVMVIEAWNKVHSPGGDRLLGLVKLPLHQFYVSFKKTDQSPIIRLAMILHCCMQTIELHTFSYLPLPLHLAAIKSSSWRYGNPFLGQELPPCPSPAIKQPAVDSASLPKKTSKKASSERARSPEPLQKASKRHHSVEKEATKSKEPAVKKSRVRPDKPKHRPEAEVESAAQTRSRSASPVPGPSGLSSPPLLQAVSPSVRAVISDSGSECEIQQEIPLLETEQTPMPPRDTAILGTEADEPPLDPETERILKENPDLVFDSLTGHFLQLVDPKNLSRPSAPRRHQLREPSPSPPRSPVERPRHRSPDRRLVRDPKISSLLLQAQYPVLAVDGPMPLVDVFSGKKNGSLKVILAMGSADQIAALQRLKNEEGIEPPVWSDQEKEGLMEHVFEIHIECIKGLTPLQSTVWGEADCYVQYHFPVQESESDILRGTEFCECGLALKAFRSSTTLYYYPNVRDQMVARGTLPLSRLCAMVTMQHREAVGIQTFSLPLIPRTESSGEHHAHSSGFLDVSIRYRRSLKVAKGILAAQTVSISVQIHSAAGLQAAASPLTERGVTSPSSYVSFVAADADNPITTDIIENTESPVWGFQQQTRLSNELLLDPQQTLVFKVWHKADVERVIGFASVDLSPLLSGFQLVCGWYNITDFSGQCQGQIKVAVSPLESITHLKKERQERSWIKASGSSIPTRTFAFQVRDMYASFPAFSTRSATELFNTSLRGPEPTNREGIGSPGSWVPRHEEHVENIRRFHESLQQAVGNVHQAERLDSLSHSSRSSLLRTLRKNLSELDEIQRYFSQKLTRPFPDSGLLHRPTDDLSSTCKNSATRVADPEGCQLLEKSNHLVSQVSSLIVGAHEDGSSYLHAHEPLSGILNQREETARNKVLKGPAGNKPSSACIDKEPLFPPGKSPCERDMLYEFLGQATSQSDLPLPANPNQREEDATQSHSEEEYEEDIIEPRMLNEVTTVTDKTSPWSSLVSEPEQEPGQEAIPIGVAEHFLKEDSTRSSSMSNITQDEPQSMPSTARSSNSPFREDGGDEYVEGQDLEHGTEELFKPVALSSVHQLKDESAENQRTDQEGTRDIPGKGTDGRACISCHEGENPSTAAATTETESEHLHGSSQDDEVCSSEQGHQREDSAGESDKAPKSSVVLYPFLVRSAEHQLLPLNK